MRIEDRNREMAMVVPEKLQQPEVIGLANEVVVDHIVRRIMRFIACGCFAHRQNAKDDVNWILGKKADEETIHNIFKACQQKSNHERKIKTP